MIQTLASFWKDKRVFLTGHTGFKGAWLSLWLNSLGAEVTGYALEPPTTPSFFDICRIDEIVTSIRADVRDRELLKDAMSKADPEIIIHMAAQPIVRDSYKDPVATYDINVMGSVHLLDAIRHCRGVKAVINITTDKCYENREWIWGYRENEPMGGYDPYSNSKACSELVTSAFRSSFFNPEKYSEHGVALASARAGNVIGGGDWGVDRLIPDCIRAVLKGNSILIRNPQAVRPWQHVLEPLAGYLLLAQSLYEEGTQYAEGWNFGPDEKDAKPVDWLVSHFCSAWGDDASYKLDTGEHPHEAHYLRLDCSKANSKLGWHPRLNLERAMDLIVDWTRAYQDGQDMRAFSLSQIKEYENLGKE